MTQHQHMTDEQATLLTQAHDMLLAHADEQRKRGNDSTAKGAECSADAVLKLAAAWAAQPVAGEAVAQIERDGVVWLNANPHRLAVGTKLYTAAPSPVGPVPLTLEQIDSMEWGADCLAMTWGMRVAAVRAVERAHKIGGA